MTTPLRLAGNARTFAFAGYAVIAAGLGFGGGWSAFANVSSAVLANGVLSVESNHKVVQHLEGGIIRELLVHDMERVEKGEVLLRLEPVQARANADLYQRQLDIALAREARLVAEQGEAAAIAFPPALVERAGDPVIAKAIADQTALFEQRRAAVANQEGMQQARIAQLHDRAKGWTIRRDAMQRQIDSLSAELKGLTALVEKGYHARNDANQLARALAGIEGDRGEAIANIAAAEGEVVETRLQIDQIHAKFREAATTELDETRTRIADLRERLTVAEDVLSRMEVRAPRAGVVHNLRFHTVGGVVRAGEPILEIVPSGDRLVIDARVSPADADAVAADMQAEVRLPAFHTRNVPLLTGRVRGLSADTDRDERTGVSFYRAEVEVDRATLPAAIAARLQPGMPAEVIIATGERTVLNYMVRPLQEAILRGMREE